MKKSIAVFGGSGYVGKSICKLGTAYGYQIISISRNGSPTRREPWMKDVEWRKGDAFNRIEYDDILTNVDGVVSTIGAFGNTSFMERVCGDANIEIANASKEAGIKNFSFLSAAGVGESIPSWSPLFGYFHGKQRAEKVIQEKFPIHGVCLRPGMITGWRNIGPFTFPLQTLGFPLECLYQVGITNRLENIPMIGNLVKRPVPLDKVSNAALLASIGEISNQSILTVHDIHSNY